MNHKPPQYGLIFAAHDEAEKMAEVARVVWVETVAELELFGALDKAQKSRLGAIDRYARYRAEFDALYPVCMSEGPVKQGKTGEYVNPKYACVNKLDEKLQKFDDMFWRWCGGKAAEKPANLPPSAARKYLDRSRGHEAKTPADEFLSS